MLQPYFQKGIVEAGVDEVGRGCIAGPVYAAAVILSGKIIPGIDDSKKLSASSRLDLATLIKHKAISWSIGIATEQEIDELNILQASFLAMNRAIDGLDVKPKSLLIDGNRFSAHHTIPYHCIVKGDAKYQSIAAASIIAKTMRDAFMAQLDNQYPHFGWAKNKGYPTIYHRQQVLQYGRSEFHRKSFRIKAI